MKAGIYQAVDGVLQPVTVDVAFIRSHFPVALRTLEAKAVAAVDPIAVDRKRIQAILTSKVAKDHYEFAQHLAFKTQLTAEDAITALANTPSSNGPIFEPSEDFITTIGGVTDVRAIFQARREAAEDQ